MALPIGGFMPIPLAMMIPFMATQSMVMGDAFGRAFQYGKRKISAMSNEEFNKTTLEQQASEMFAAYKNIIPKLSDSMEASSELQTKIINQMLLILPKFIADTGTATFGGTDIKTPIEDHAHTSDRPHTHSGGPPTITGSTTSNGITTTHYSDGTSTTSGTKTTISSGKITLQESNKLRLQYSQNIQNLQSLLAKEKSKVWQTRTQFISGKRVTKFIDPIGRAKSLSAIIVLEKEITQQKLFLSRVNRLEAPF